MNIFQDKIKTQKTMLAYKMIGVFVFFAILFFEGIFFYIKTKNQNQQALNLESKMSFIETQRNRLIFENSLVVKADAMYNNSLLNKSFNIESYVSDLKHLVQSVSNYYGLFNPVTVTVSYNNAVVGSTYLVPVDISISMSNIFDYTPLRLIFVLFNNTLGTMNCNGLSISREHSGGVFENLTTNGYLFASKINIQWFVLLKPRKSNFRETFVIHYHKVKDLEKIEHAYNMATWDESFMIFPNDIDKLREMQQSMR
ncbi:MAG: hypothetical protein KBC27_03800 [Rickettsiales bacterium]|nr:hypothetical protein [Rickettsiales bacterium]